MVFNCPFSFFLCFWRRKRIYFQTQILCPSFNLRYFISIHVAFLIMFSFRDSHKTIRRSKWTKQTILRLTWFCAKTFWTHNTIALCQSEIALLPVQAAKRLFLDFIYLSLFFFLMCLYISHLSSKSQAFLTCCENATLSPLFTSTNVVSNPFRTLFHQNSSYYLVEVKSVRLVGNLQTRRKTEWFDMFVRLC